MYKGEGAAGALQIGALFGFWRVQPGLPGQGQLEWAILCFEVDQQTVHFGERKRNNSIELALCARRIEVAVCH